MEIKQWVKYFMQLCIRIGKATQFIKDAIPIKQKVRRIPIHFYERVEEN